MIQIWDCAPQLNAVRLPRVYPATEGGERAQNLVNGKIQLLMHTSCQYTSDLNTLLLPWLALTTAFYIWLANSDEP